MVMIFWLIGLFIVYVYIGYPIMVCAFSKLVKNRRPELGDIEPRTVTIVIAAYNEEQYIRQKVINALECTDKLIQVIVVSDGSSDETDHIVQSIDDERLVFLRSRERQGKAAALNRAIPLVKGDVTLFSDANVMFSEGAVDKLLGAFADERCGAVSGRVELVALDSGEPLGEGLYMRYERYVQSCEEGLKTMIGCDGGMFAVRTNLLSSLPERLILDDLYLAARVVEKGAQVCYEHQAVAQEAVPARVSQEFRRKVRIAAGGFQILPLLGLFRAPWRNPVASWMFYSHKVFRWVSGLGVFAFFFLNWALAKNGLAYNAIFAVQCGCWAAGLAALLFQPLRSNRFFYFVYYFGAINLASILGLMRFVGRGQVGIWNRVDR